MIEPNSNIHPLEVSQEISDALAEQVRRRKELFNALVNSEPTCATLLALAELESNADKNTTGHFLHRAFLVLTDNAWLINERGPAQYCDSTLIPSGLVTKDGNEFFLTAAAKKYGVRAAQELLLVSERLPYSLRKIFGATAAADQLGSVFTRAAILEHLSNQSNRVSATDISKALGIQYKIIGWHLQKMSEIGLVEYTSANFEDHGQFTFEVTFAVDQIDSLTSRVYGYPTLARQVLTSMLGKQESSQAELFKELSPLYAGKEKSLGTSISEVLTKLISLGACKPALLRNVERHSSSQITEIGQLVVREVIDPIRQIVDSPPTDATQGNWEAAAPQAVERYAAEVGNTKRQSFEQRAERILSIIANHSEKGVRPSVIQQEFGSGDYLKILRFLLQTGQIRQEKKGKAVYYFSNTSS